MDGEFIYYTVIGGNEVLGPKRTGRQTEKNHN
jgi:hypothetical protein